MNFLGLLAFGIVIGFGMGLGVAVVVASADVVDLLRSWLESRRRSN